MTEELLTQASWLRHLAARLAGAAADDVVQDTWIAALRHPPTTDRPVRPWLVRVVRNAARFRWRSDANRRQRETALVAETETATPTSEELLARHELQQLLARLVTELDEPFRSTILLRYAEGLEPSQIARRLNIPAGTIRWRLKEALERLRCGLDALHDGDRKRWLLAFAPLVRWAASSAGAASAPAGSAPTTTGSETTPAGAAPPAPLAAATATGLALRVGAGIVAVGAVIAIAVVVTRPPADEQRDAIAAHPTTRIVPAPTVDAIAAGWRAQEGAPARHLAGRVVFAGAPVAGAQVRLTSEATPAIETRSDADGRFDLGAQDARPVTIGAAAPDRLAMIRHVDLRDPTASADLELELLPCGMRLDGHVTDAAGTPIAHAQLRREDSVGTETDGAGAYALCLLPTAAWASQLDVVIRADGYGAIVVGIAATGHNRRDFMLAPEATITGTAAPGADVWIEADGGDDRTAGSPARAATVADADGKFRFDGASGGTYRIGAAARGTTAVARRVAVEAGGTTDVALAMTPAAIVRGTLTSKGRPVAGAHVAIKSTGSVIRHDDAGRDPIAIADAVTQPDGTFVLDGLPAGAITLSASPLRLVSPDVTLVAGDNRVALDGEPLGRLRGTIRRHGVPVPYARLDLAQHGLTTDAAGRYEVDGLEPGRHGFFADDMRRGAYFAGESPAIEGSETRDFDIELAWGGQIRGTVVDLTGAPLAGYVVRFTNHDTTETCRTVSEAGGAFTCGMLDHGTFVASVHPGDDTTRPLPFAVAVAPIVVASGDAVIDTVRLVVDPRTAAIAGTLVDEAGAPAADVRVRVYGDPHAVYGWSHAPSAMTDAAGRFRIAGLSPGDYEVDADSADGVRSAQRTVATGNDTTITLAPIACGTAGAASPASRPSAPVVWDDRIELVGWDMPASAAHDTAVDIALVFRVRAPVAHPWTLFAHLDGPSRVNADHAPVCPTSAWRTGDVIVDRFTARMPHAGRFTLRIGWFRRANLDGPWENLALAGGDANVGAELGAITAE